MPANIPVRAGEPLSFPGEVPVAARLAACREFLRTEMASLRRRHESGSSGLTICRERAQIIDALLIHLFAYAIRSYSPPSVAPCRRSPWSLWAGTVAASSPR